MLVRLVPPCVYDVYFAYLVVQNSYQSLELGWVELFFLFWHALLFGISLSQSTNYDEQDSATPLSEAEAIDLVKTVFASATERDIYTVIFFHHLYPYYGYLCRFQFWKFVFFRVTSSKSSFLMLMAFVANTWTSEKISMVLGSVECCCNNRMNCPSAVPVSVPVIIVLWYLQMVKF